MTINRAQRAIVIGALVALGGLGVYPPWRCVEQRRDVKDDFAYARAPLWAPPRQAAVEVAVWDCDDARVAGDRLLVSWSVVAALAGALALAVGFRRGPQG
jgi:hypothetical protein